MGQHFQKEIVKLKKLILSMGSIVEEQFQKSVSSLSEGSVTLAMEVIQLDRDVDRMELDIEEEGLKILALHQPVAGDLRFIISVLKINTDLERIGDLCVNVSERVIYLAANKIVPNPLNFATIAEKTRDMLKKSLDALINLDTEIAQHVCRQDNEITEINQEMFQLIETAIIDQPRNVRYYLHLLSCARHLERIAGHTTSIAEDVIYMIDGKIVRHHVEDLERFIDQIKSGIPSGRGPIPALD